MPARMRIGRVGDEPLAVDLDPAIGAKICGMVDDMNLSVAGVDLRCSPADRWYCFEVNPSPGFMYYQAASGQPISQAIAQRLAKDMVREI